MQKSDIITDMKYAGEVNVKFNINGKLVDVHNHNSGLPNLFRLIARALAGYNTSLEKPDYIDLRYITAKSPVWQSCLSKKQSIAQLSYHLENGSWITKAASTIPYSALSITPISNLNAAAFRLYLMSDNSDLAYININENDIAEIVPGTQALVEWILKISNSN